MTQEYEPIKLNESTPEPREDGIYLLTITFKPETKTMPLFKDGNEYLGADSSYSWEELVKELSTADEATIQSLADHDAQIRADALRLTDKEARAALDMWNDIIADSDDGIVGMQKAFTEIAEFRGKQES